MYLSYVIASYHRQLYCNIVISLYMYLSYVIVTLQYCCALSQLYYCLSP